MLYPWGELEGLETRVAEEIGLVGKRTSVEQLVRRLRTRREDGGMEKRRPEEKEERMWKEERR